MIAVCSECWWRVQFVGTPPTACPRCHRGSWQSVDAPLRPYHVSRTDALFLAALHITANDDPHD